MIKQLESRPDVWSLWEKGMLKCAGANITKTREILNTLPPKIESFPIKILIVFIFRLKTRLGGSNEYQQSMILSRNKANNVYPCEPQF